MSEKPKPTERVSWDFVGERERLLWAKAIIGLSACALHALTSSLKYPTPPDMQVREWFLKTLQHLSSLKTLSEKTIMLRLSSCDVTMLVRNQTR